MKAENPATLASIEFLRGPLQGQTFSIQKPTITIGRDLTNDIVVGNDPKVSRLHARLLWKDGVWNIERVSQSSFVSVNQQKVQLAPIADNAVVRLGDDSTFVFRSSMQGPASQLPGAQTLAGQQLAEQTIMRPQNQVPVQQGLPPHVAQALPPPQRHIPPTPTGQYEALTAQLGGLVGRPDATQIASHSMVGLPSIEVTSYSHSDKIIYALAKPVINLYVCTF